MTNTIHAEQAVINKLPILPRNKHLKLIDICVVRINKPGCWSLSKPCIECVNYMNQIAPQKGYRIRRVYYSQEDGTIVYYTLNDLVDDENYHMSKYLKRKILKKI